MNPNFFAALAACRIRLGALWTTFEGNSALETHRVAVESDSLETACFGAAWRLETTIESAPEGGFQLVARFELLRGEAANLSVALQWEFEGWSTRNYVLLPAAAYNGNRFFAAQSHRVADVAHPHTRMSVVISPQQRLNVAHGPSRLQFRSGDLAAPSVAIHLKNSGTAFWLQSGQSADFSGDLNGVNPDYGLSLEESLDRSRAVLSWEAPCVRGGEAGHARGDRGAAWQVGSSCELRLRLEIGPCHSVPALFETLFARRERGFETPRARQEIPFASVWQTKQDKYNAQNWVEEYGYYSVGMRESAPQNWQTAWVGGLNTLFALLGAGDETTRDRALRTFDFLRDGGVFPSGFLRDRFHEGEWNSPENLLARYNGDGLYFLMRCLLLLRARGHEVAPAWEAMTRDIARAWVVTWDTFGELGHRLDGESGAIVWGGSCSAALAPGGLILAAHYFNEPDFERVARASGRLYRDEFLRVGLTNGGPGDALQCPDSESAGGLLESFATLWEATGDAYWREAAREAAHHVASWTMPYDFDFPPTSTFGKLGMTTRGTVWANIQNKHSAPGLCTLSGVGLLKLFRATGEAGFLDLLCGIAGAIPQYMSRADRPIPDIRPDVMWPVMAPGWTNERINTSDWEERGTPGDIRRGEIFGGSTWSEAAMMLTWAELPGLYLQKDTGFLRVLDHVEARFDGETLEIYNPTAFGAQVKLLVETSADLGRPLGPIFGPDLPRVAVGPGQKVKLAV